MKADKLRELDTNALKVQLNEIGETLFRLRFQLTMGQTEGLKKFRALKKDRARILTLLQERDTPARAEQKGKQA